MAWPLSQDYNEALQNPQSSFSDAELRQGQVVVNALGIPQPCSGNFADVYAVECPASNTKWAVKCFTREVHGLRERYSAISQYLQQARLPFTVDFQYLEQGIRIAGRWYPVLKMHWVEGFTLNAFVRDMLDKPATLEGLSRIWLRMAGRLREAKLGHCDLQHGNVLLVPGSNASSLAVKLIDYDGMWVPALANTPSGEVGHPAYQHPQRLRQGGYNPDVDRFPLLAIYVALRALVVGGRPLWERFDTGDNLLFRQTDFETPNRSALFAELLRMNAPDVRELVVKLIDAARLSLEQTAHLTDLVAVEAAPQRREKNAAPAEEADETPIIIRRPRRRKRSKKPLVWMSAILLVLLAGGGALYWGLSPAGTGKKPATAPMLAQTTKEAPPPAPEEKTSDPPNVKQPPTRVDEKNPSPKANANDNDPPPLPDRPIPSPEKTKPARPAVETKPSDPPRSTPKPLETPTKPAEAPLPILEGPLGEVRRFAGHDGDVIGVALSPDGKRALSASSDKSVRLWDIASGETIHTLNGHTQMVWSVAFSPDGKRAVSAGYDNTVRLWDLDKGEEIRVLNGHTAAVRRAVFSPDGKHVFSAGLDKIVRQWDAGSGEIVGQYSGNNSDAYWMDLSPDGKRILSGGGDKEVHCWQVGGRELLPLVGNTSHVYAIDCSADGKLVAASGGDRIVRIWRMEDRKLLHNLAGHTGQVNAVAFLPDGRLLSSAHDGTIRLWDVRTGQELGRFHGAEGSKILSVVAAPKGNYFLSGDSEKLVRVWRVPPPDVLAAKPNDAVEEALSFTGHTANVRRVAFSFEGRRILSAGYDDTARLWETATGREVFALRHKKANVTTVAFLPDGRRALSGGNDGAIRLWDLRDGRELRAFTEHTNSVNYVVVSSDGQRAVSGSGDPAVLVWDVENGEVLHRLEGHPRGVECVGLSPDGRWAATGSPGGAIRLWEAASGKEIRALQEGHTRDVQSLRFTPDSRLLLSASRDKTLRLWDVESGKELRRFEGHTDMVEGAALSPDGRRAISAGRDGTVRLWDVASGKELHRFLGHKGIVWDAAYSPDGHYAVSAGEDKTLRLWRLPFAPFVVGQPLELKAESVPLTVKLPVPDKAAQDSCEKEIRNTYKVEYDNRQPAQQAALAVKLLEHGQNAKDKTDRRFVFLREASNAAVQAGEMALSLQALDEMSKTFADFDALPLKSAVLERFVSVARGSEGNKRLLLQILAVLDEAEAADAYEPALKLLAAAQKVSPKVSDRYLSAVVKQRRTRMETLRKVYGKIAAAVQTLADSPRDAEANLLAGSFECFDKEDWRKGLPLLARSSDKTLAELARKDLSQPMEAGVQAELGQSWWTFAAKQSGANLKSAAQRRARHWFREALPRLNGMDKERIEERLAKKVGRLNLRPGLIAELYADETFEKRVKARLDYKIDFNWGLGAADDKLPPDHFSIRWQGYLIPPRPGRYTLTVVSDDGARLSLEENSFIDFWTTIGRHDKVIEVNDMKPIRIRLDYHEIINEASVRLLWSLEGGFAEQPIGVEALYHESKQERLLAP
jgi:WD40 repeat protein